MEINSCQIAHDACKQLKQRSVSMDDDDNGSSHTPSSTNLLQSTVSDSESATPISVRDMVKRYNSVAKVGSKLSKTRNPSVASSKSSYSDVNNYTAPPSVKQFVTQLQEGVNESQLTSNKREVLNCRSRSRLNAIKSSDNMINCDNADKISCVLKETKDLVNGFKEPTPILKNALSNERNSLQRISPVEENSNVPAESSYQSKTTIAKTSSGVRIIIDIFFDQEQHKVSAADVVGSRVETDIPQSRILTEFQQQVHQVTAAQQLSSATN